MNTERLELAEHIAQVGHEINWKATVRRASYSENTSRRKITEAIDIPRRENRMNGRLEDGRVSDNFAYCLSKPGENKNITISAKRRHLDQESFANLSTRDRDEKRKGGDYQQSSEDVVSG
ncbi:unnamed protein product [Protopolystoma xenopodis]|uniref:Uncharacterized protein n=1 Tax=Protopolystoma xenopodis TaxID=117903 RepID=A0A3S5A7E0_9PLAT|nr:unnamed protein product [Protopolystoma xenopodis]